jgi:AAA family ATP:ADP antiporter
VDPVRTYQAKAWIDMLGYRLFKVVGSFLIIGFTQILDVGGLSWLTVAICVTWLALIAALGREYTRIRSTPIVA